MENDANSSAVPTSYQIALQRAKIHAHELEQFIAWEDELFSNSQLSTTHKLAIRATRRAVARGQTKDEKGRTRINIGTIATQIGVSADTMSRSIKALQAYGVIKDRENKPEIQEETGERWTRAYVSLDEEKLASPKGITPPEPRRHGGNRHHQCQKCCSTNCKCNGDNVKIRTTHTLVCKCCKHEVELDTTERDQERDMQDAGRHNDMPDTNNARTSSSSTEPQDAFESEKGTHTLQIPDGEQNGPSCQPGQDGQVPGQEKQVAFEPSEPDDSSFCSPTSNLRPLLKPDSPPMPVVATVPQVAGRQNASSSCSREDDQEPEGHLAFSQGVCTGYPLPDLGVGEQPYGQPGQNGQVPDQQDAFDSEKGTHTLQIPDGEQNGSFCQPRQDDQVPGQEKQVAFASHAPILDLLPTLEVVPTSECESTVSLDAHGTSTVPDGTRGQSEKRLSITDAKPAHFDDVTKVRAAAELLLALGGPAPRHIFMNEGEDAKYKSVSRPITLSDTLSHLHGGKARGALCFYPGNQTRGLAWDTDDTDDIATWQVLQQAMRTLADNGYIPILSPSPAGRGGHAWIVFDDLVQADAARAHVESLAPSLATFKEYWPPRLESAAKWNRVRLPGGRYVRPGVNAWCQLVSVTDEEIATCGQESARLLLQHQTPAGIVPDVTPRQNAEQTPGANFVDANKVTEQMHDHFIDANNKIVGSRREEAAPTSLPHAEVDQAWLARYDTPEGKRLWFAFTPRFIADWYNARHSVEELLPSESNGYGLASWRGERTASVKKRGEQWTDFGANARRDGGSPDGGDALELQVRVSQAPKPEVLRQIVREELLPVAVPALEQAARSGQAIPSWLVVCVRPAGYRHYARLAEQAGHMTLAREARAKASQIEQAEAHQGTPQNEVGQRGRPVGVDNPEIFGGQMDAVTPTKSVTVPGQDARDTGKVRFEIAVNDARSTPVTGKFPATPPVGGLSGFSSNPIENPRKTPTGTTNASGTTDAHEGTVPTNGTTVPPHSQAESVSHALVECYHLQHGEPCLKCACELYRDLEGNWQCCRCYPLKGYHQYKNTVDWLYPCKYERFGGGQA